MDPETAKHWVVAVDVKGWSLRPLAHALFLAGMGHIVTCLFIGEETEESVKFLESAERMKKRSQDDFEVRGADIVVKHEYVPSPSDMSTSTIGTLICDFVKSQGADYLVMGQRGLGVFAKAVKGSVSSYCVEHAIVPVMVVRKIKKAGSKARPGARKGSKDGLTLNVGERLSRSRSRSKSRSRSRSRSRSKSPSRQKDMYGAERLLW